MDNVTYWNLLSWMCLWQTRSRNSYKNCNVCIKCIWPDNDQKSSVETCDRFRRPHKIAKSDY